MSHKLRLGINIDHVATVRNARGSEHPCPIEAAQLAHKSGADGITAHLREDRRHIRDADIFRLKEEVNLPLKMEMAATDEMLGIALKVKPNAACIVPERREELTTEGGLNVAQSTNLKNIIPALKDAGIRVSLFIDPDATQTEAAKAAGADIVEYHTGALCHATDEAVFAQELAKLEAAALHGDSLGLECHAGHGISYANVSAIASIAPLHELNIGHFLMGQAIFVGLEKAIAQMRVRMDKARA